MTTPFDSGKLFLVSALVPFNIPIRKSTAYASLPTSVTLQQLETTMSSSMTYARQTQALCSRFMAIQETSRA